MGWRQSKQHPNHCTKYPPIHHLFEDTLPFRALGATFDMLVSLLEIQIHVSFSCFIGHMALESVLVWSASSFLEVVT